MKRKPTHPGVLFLAEVLKPTETSIAQFARDNDYSYPAMHAILHGQVRLTERAAQAFADHSKTTKSSWLAMQNQLDLWHIYHSE